MILYLLDEEPSEVWAHGNAFLNPGVEDVVFCYLRFPSGKIAHMHLSWLDPHKMRRMTVVGREKMVVFDDMELERKVTVYEKAPWQPARDATASGARARATSTARRSRTTSRCGSSAEHFLRLVAGEGDPLQAARDGARRRPRARAAAGVARSRRRVSATHLGSPKEREMGPRSARVSCDE